MSTYSFPLLDNSEILACLAELDIPFSEANLLKPTYEVVKPLYETLVTMLVGVSRYDASFQRREIESCLTIRAWDTCCRG